MRINLHWGISNLLVLTIIDPLRFRNCVPAFLCAKGLTSGVDWSESCFARYE